MVTHTALALFLAAGALPPGPAPVADTVLGSPTQARAPTAESAARPTPLDELVTLARERNPEVEVARRRAAAAEARVPQAGALPDPTLTGGLMYGSVPDLHLSAEGTMMFSLQLAQMIPVPGSRRMREDVAEAFHRAALHDVEETEIQVIARLKKAYHELVFVHQSEDVLRRNLALLGDLAEVAGGRLAVGRVPQQDVLRAQTEVTRMDEQLVALEERRTAALIEINEVLDRDPFEPVVPEYPGEVRRVATATPPPGAFTAASLEEGLGPELPSLKELQGEAVRSRPSLVGLGQRIEAMRRNRDLAVRERWPDLGVMVAYGPRVGGPDMVSVGLSVDLPLFRGRKQDQAVLEAGETLAEHEARHREIVADVRSEVARRYNALVRTRERLLLVGDGVIPQARATVESATGAYQAGRVEFASLLEAQAVLFRNEIELTRLLADFGRELAELEATVGRQIDLTAAEGGSAGHNDREMNR
jgi:outer membrane protein, heavy metal efflux system